MLVCLRIKKKLEKSSICKKPNWVAVNVDIFYFWLIKYLMQIVYIIASWKSQCKSNVTNSNRNLRNKLNFNPSYNKIVYTLTTKLKMYFMFFHSMTWLFKWSTRFTPTINSKLIDLVSSLSSIKLLSSKTLPSALH